MKKESKVQKILMLILSFTLLTTSLLASTISRYVSEQNAPFGKEEYVDYTVNSVFVVKNQEELFAAINQGYTYVQLDQNIENPLIVTQKAENLDADLILDLNGIEIQRNGYEPILNIKKDVRLTIVDTSAEQTGGLYNPVGSVFNITGGTLTVVTGTFESGPRYSEYFSYNTDVLNTSDPTKRTLVENSAKKVYFYEKTTNSDGTWTFSGPTEKEAPIIKSYPEKIGKVEYTHGNLYFDQTVTKGDLTINPDTYCYYRTSEDKAAEVNNEAAADWYYTYYVDPNNGFNYAEATVPAADEENYVKITIYGYENTIKQAAADKDPKDYYAAIQMQDGTLDVQNGGFYSYFGVDKTACVNAQKGDLKIKKGKFSSRIPNATRYNANSVVIKEADEVAFEETYFDNYHWSSDAVGATYRGNLARQGESYCILNGGSANVTIGTGDLYSSNNGIINMQGGNLSISGGTFYKRLTNGRVTADEAEMSAIYMSQGALNISDAKCYVLRNDPLDVDGANGNENTHAICMKNGTLNVTDTTYHMEGDNSIGVKMESGKLAVTGGMCEILGSDTYGIYSTVTGAGNFVVTNTSFALSGTDAKNQTGIYANNSQVQVISNTATPSTISIIGTNGKGIHVQGSDSIVESTNYNYALNGDSSMGIHIEAGKLTVSNGSCEIKGSNVYGIYSTVSGENNFYVENMPFTLTDGNTQTGIYSSGGKVVVNAIGESKTISTNGSNSKGIHVASGGSVVSTNYNYSLTGSESIGILAQADATGINVTNGKMDIKGYRSFGIHSSISGTNTFTVTNVPISMTDGEEQTGIYAQNGRVNISAGSSTTISIDDNNGKGVHVGSGGSVVSSNYSYSLNGDNSYGIYSTGGLVKLTGGDITLASNVSCYGVYAFSASTTDLLNILIDSATINVGYTNNPITKSGSVNSCIGVFLATKNNSNFIDLINANIYSFEVGVALCGGALNFEGQGSISTNLASAIAVKGGNITFKNKSEGKYITNADSNYVITSNNTTTNQATNAYTIKLPNFNSFDEIEYSNYQNTDGIYVEGGAFVSNGDLQLTHTGLRNPTTDINNNNYNYTSVRVTSYAVRVLGGNVNILKGDIKAIIGGGIYSGSINDVSGNITMGNNSTQESDITVTADGALSGNIFWATIRANTGSWSNRISLTGGNAIELAGGNITIYNGYYESQFLNGVAANSSGVINIYNGKFFGWMNNSNNNGDMKPSSNSRKSGPSAHYGLKVIGGATVNIFGGIFDGGNGGAFVTGVDSSTIKYTNGTNSNNVKLSFNANGPRAQVYIYGGTFGDPANIGKDIQALDGFNVYDHSTVIFGAYRAPNSTGVDSTLVSPYTNKTEYQQGIVINAENATIAANPIAYATAASSGTTKSQSIITIYYGTYNLGRSGIYNDKYDAQSDCANIKIYNTNNSVGYTLIAGDYTTLVNNITARYYPYANNN